MFYFKRSVSETAFCFRLQVAPTQLSSTGRGSLSLQIQRTATGFMKLT
jgi:hypothetical protein